jgi:hypothetical protein
MLVRPGRFTAPASPRLGRCGPVAVAFATWWSFVFPANRELATWLSGEFPADRAGRRTRWEYAHAARALFQVVGLATVVLSLVLNAPDEPERL